VAQIYALTFVTAVEYYATTRTRKPHVTCKFVSCSYCMCCSGQFGQIYDMSAICVAVNSPGSGERGCEGSRIPCTDAGRWTSRAFIHTRRGSRHTVETVLVAAPSSIDMLSQDERDAQDAQADGQIDGRAAAHAEHGQRRGSVCPARADRLRAAERARLPAAGSDQLQTPVPSEGVAMGVEPTSVELTSVEPASGEPASVEPTSVEPTSVEPTNVEPTSVWSRRACGSDERVDPASAMAMWGLAGAAAAGAGSARSAATAGAGAAAVRHG
jgi:hypothetical protein